MKNNSFTLKQAAFIVIFLVSLVAIPITVYLAGQQQSTQSRASAPKVVADDTVVAVINGKNITKLDVMNVALEQYKEADVDSLILQLALKELEEREILEKAVTDLSIVVDANKIEELVADEGLPQNVARYQVIKNQVALRLVRSKEAMTIQFWNTPESGLSRLSDEEKTLSEQQLSDGLKALTEAEEALVAGGNVLAIAEELLEKYPSLKPVLAVNGLILGNLSTADREIALTPQYYEFGDSGLDSETEQVLFTARLNDVKLVTNTSTNRGGIVFKIISSNDAGEGSYDEWYAKQEASLIQNLGLL